MLGIGGIKPPFSDQGGSEERKDIKENSTINSMNMDLGNLLMEAK